MKRFLALAVASSLALAGCSDGKPSQDEYVAALQNRSKAELADDAPEIWSQYMDDLMLCVGDETRDGVSSEYIQAVIDGDGSYEPTAEELSVLEAATTECTEKIPMPVIDDDNLGVVDDQQYEDGTEFTEDFEDGVGEVDEFGEPVEDTHE